MTLNNSVQTKNVTRKNNFNAETSRSCSLRFATSPLFFKTIANNTPLLARMHEREGKNVGSSW